MDAQEQHDEWLDNLLRSGELEDPSKEEIGNLLAEKDLGSDVQELVGSVRARKPELTDEAIRGQLMIAGLIDWD
jgi:hypothetical protein